MRILANFICPITAFFHSIIETKSMKANVVFVFLSFLFSIIAQNYAQGPGKSDTAQIEN